MSDLHDTAKRIAERRELDELRATVKRLEKDNERLSENSYLQAMRNVEQPVKFTIKKSSPVMQTLVDVHGWTDSDGGGESVQDEQHAIDRGPPY